MALFRKKPKIGPPIYKEYFEKVTQNYFDENLMTALYKDDEFILCNAANQVYLLFPYQYLDYGIVVNKKNALQCVLNYREIIVALSKTTEEVLNANTVLINDKFYKFLVESKEKNDIEGHTEFVDPEIDKAILKYGKKIPAEIQIEFYNKYQN